MTITTKQARESAQQFCAAVSSGRQWSIATVEAYLPEGYGISDSAEDADFFPVTIANVARAMRAHAIRVTRR